MRNVLAVYFWIFALIITVSLGISITVIAFVNKTLLGGRFTTDRFCHGIAALWARSVFGLMPGWRVDVSGRERIRPDLFPYVVVSNHESMADIWVIYFLNMQFRWMAKDSLFKIPIVGSAMRGVGYVSIKRGDRDSHGQALEESRNWLRRGVSMFFFPEGTRSTEGLKKFKIGAFKIAREERRPILPVAIHGAGALLPKKSTSISPKATIQIRILEPVMPETLEGMDLDAAADHIRSLILREHQSILQEENAFPSSQARLDVSLQKV